MACSLLLLFAMLTPLSALAAGNNNGYREPNPRMPIACTAAHYVYNTQGKCTADSIQMDGSQAMAKNETACATFKNRQ